MEIAPQSGFDKAATDLELPAVHKTIGLDGAGPRWSGKPIPLSREPEPVPTGPPGADAFQLCLREVGQIKLLTPQEELALAQRIKRGDPEAREQMIRGNLRRVVKIARAYEGLGLHLLDLICEGNIGLIKGVERFEPGKGAKLSTYVTWWVKQSIKRALSNQFKTNRSPIDATHPESQRCIKNA